MPKNTICHIEVAATDPGKSSQFYQHLFGWGINTDMGEEYVFFQPESEPGGAFMKVDNVISGGGVIFYVEVDDIEMCLKKIAELGGKEVKPKTEIPGHGWYGQFSDPDRNIIGLFTGSHAQKQ